MQLIVQTNTAMIIEIKVHPMSKRILEAEYGAQPLSISRHDILFSYLCFRPMDDRMSYHRARLFLTSRILIDVNDKLAYHIARDLDRIGLTLFKLHKDLMCRHAAAAVQNGQVARKAILAWLEMHGIEEDEFGLETAYKKWQRFQWQLEKKNMEFSSHFRYKTAVKVAKKMEAKMPLIMQLGIIEIELKLSTFIECLKENIKVPKAFNGHARCYLYVVIGKMSARKAASLLGIHRSNVDYGVKVVKAWAAKNRMVAHCLAQISALPDK